MRIVLTLNYNYLIFNMVHKYRVTFKVTHLNALLVNQNNIIRIRLSKFTLQGSTNENNTGSSICYRWGIYTKTMYNLSNVV